MQLSLTSWLLLAMVAGAWFGALFPAWAEHLEFLSAIFLRLIRSIIAPVLVGVLLRAIGGAGNLRALGRVGWKSVAVFEVSTTCALLLGWCGAYFVRPGAGVALQSANPVVPGQAQGLAEALQAAFPTSIVDALARGDVVQIVVFCFLFGIACLAVGEKARPIVGLAGALAEVAFRYTHYVMRLAPLAVFAAAAKAFAGDDALLVGMAAFSGLAWGAQALFLATFAAVILAACRIPVRRLLRFAREPFVIGFATTSSAAALPKTLENLDRFGIPKRVTGVVAPLSLSLNMNGSTIHLGMATLFIAQAAGIDLSLGQQAVILLTLKLTSKGVAGVPRANFVILAAIFQSHGLPMEGLAILLGIDALIDPIRTSVNVASHFLAPVAIARWEGWSLGARSAGREGS